YVVVAGDDGEPAVVVAVGHGALGAQLAVLLSPVPGERLGVVVEVDPAHGGTPLIRRRQRRPARPTGGTPPPRAVPPCRAARRPAYPPCRGRGGGCRRSAARPGCRAGRRLRRGC